MESDGTRKRTGGEVKGKKANRGSSQQSCTVSDTVYPALLPLIRTPRLPAADWTDTPADINGLIRFAGKPNLVSARVPSGSISALQLHSMKILCILRTVAQQYVRHYINLYVMHCADKVVTANALVSTVTWVVKGNLTNLFPDTPILK